MPAQPQDKVGEVVVGLLLLGAVCFCGAWTLGWVFSRLPSTKDNPERTRARASLELAATSAFGFSEVRTQERFAGSVNLYLGKIAFENVPVPDRPQIIARLASVWCTGRILGHLVFRDIRNDEVLDSRSCLWHSMSATKS